MEKKMSIKELSTSPYQTLRFMIEGLREQSKRKDFVVNMNTFGTRCWNQITQRYVCSGCAATCAIQKIARKNLTHENITEEVRAEYLGFDRDEVEDFEGAVDDARGGQLYPLYVFHYGPARCGTYTEWAKVYGDINDELDCKSLSFYAWELNIDDFEEIIERHKTLLSNPPMSLEGAKTKQL